MDVGCLAHVMTSGASVARTKTTQTVRKTPGATIFLEGSKMPTFEQRGIPRKYPDALASVAKCECGFEMYGCSVTDLKEIFGRFGCPACHKVGA